MTVRITVFLSERVLRLPLPLPPVLSFSKPAPGLGPGIGFGIIHDRPISIRELAEFALHQTILRTELLMLARGSLAAKSDANIAGFRPDPKPDTLAPWFSPVLP